MLTLRKVAVTGGLSCGKSSVCRFLKELGAYVLSADTIVHQQLTPLTKLGQQVVNLLGPDIVDGPQLNRSRIAQKVFNDPKLLRELEKLTHPLVKEEIQTQYSHYARNPKTSLFVVEIALLYEIHWSDLFDTVIAVIADPEICQRRYIESGHTQEDYNVRMKAQMDPLEKARQADYIIENNGSLHDLTSKVESLFKILNQL